MSVLLKKKISNFNERKQELETRYLQLGNKFQNTKENGEKLLIDYDLLLELDELLYEVHYEKSKIKLTNKRLSQSQNELLDLVTSYEHALEERINISIIIAEAPELAVTRRRLLENAEEGAKITVQMAAYGKQGKRVNSEAANTIKKRAKISPPMTTWLDSGKWGKDHVRCIFEGSREKKTTAEKTTGVQDLFKERLGAIISGRAVFYFFLHYGIRDLPFDHKKLNEAFNEAYTKYQDLATPKRFESIREYIKENLGLHISKNDTSCGIQFRDILSKVYGSLKEPESNLQDITGTDKRNVLSDRDEAKNKHDEEESTQFNVSHDTSIIEEPMLQKSNKSRHDLTIVAPAGQSSQNNIFNIIDQIPISDSFKEEKILIENDKKTNDNEERTTSVPQSSDKVQPVHKLSLNKESIAFDNLIYQIMIASKPDTFYRNKLDNLSHSSYWTFELNKILIETVEYLSSKEISSDNSTVEIGRKNIVNLIVVRVKRDLKMNMKPLTIRKRLITMMELDVFSKRGAKLIHDIITPNAKN